MSAPALRCCVSCGKLAPAVLCDGCRAELAADASWDAIAIGCHLNDVARAASSLARSFVLLQLAHLASKIVRSAPSPATSPQDGPGSAPPAGRPKKPKLRVIN